MMISKVVVLVWFLDDQQNEQNKFCAYVNEKSAKRLKYLSNKNETQRVRIERYVANVKSEDSESQLWDTRWIWSLVWGEECEISN